MKRSSAILLGLILILLLAGCSTGGSRPFLYPDHYTVRKGDTLYSIAWRFKLDHKELARWNGIGPPYTIYPGQRLVMNPMRAYAEREPAPASSRSASTSASTSTTSSSATTSSTPRVTTSRPPATAATAPAGPAPTAWLWPTKGEVVRKFSHNAAGKKGIDISGTMGQPVVATAAGRVVYSGSGLLGYGQLIIINHNKNYLSAYAHNSSLLVKEGDVVEAGQQIAKLGDTGTDRPMLHFEIRRDGRPVDPLKYLPGR
jgi:lipoprotein NlpD